MTGNQVADLLYILVTFDHGKQVTNVTVEADAFYCPSISQVADEADVHFIFRWIKAS